MRASAWVAASVLLAFGLAGGELRAQPKADQRELAIQADKYFQGGNMVAALPLYEQLTARAPNDPLYAERLAYCLLSKLENLPEGPEREATIARARAEAERAQAMGDSSNLLGLVLQRTKDPAAAKNNMDAALGAAEAAFARGDLDTALAKYREIAAADPTHYAARLFAGDVYFRRHEVKLAGEWFQQAIAIDPNRETAYRYWGDALSAGGEPEAALQKFIEAVVAEPYDSRAWMGLSQWAKRNRATLAAPHIPVPQSPTVRQGRGGKPQTTLYVDPSRDQTAAAPWLAYSTNRALWRGEEFAKQFPAEKAYRHSLPEEVQSLTLAVAVIDKPDAPLDQLAAELRDLVHLARDQMLEPYVLLSAADEGIARDYAAYRAEHRDQLHAYLEKYVLHRDAARDVIREILEDKAAGGRHVPK